MNLLPMSGIYELFIPELEPGQLYKYELKLKDGLTYLKADPYANASELRPATASVTADLSQFSWADREWMRQRKKLQKPEQPMFVYEMPGESRRTAGNSTTTGNWPPCWRST